MSCEESPEPPPPDVLLGGCVASRSARTICSGIDWMAVSTSPKFGPGPGLGGCTGAGAGGCTAAGTGGAVTGVLDTACPPGMPPVLAAGLPCCGGAALLLCVMFASGIIDHAPVAGMCGDQGVSWSYAPRELRSVITESDCLWLIPLRYVRSRHPARWVYGYPSPKVEVEIGWKEVFGSRGSRQELRD